MPGRAPRPSRFGTVPWPAEVADRYFANGHWEGRPLTEFIADAADADPRAVAVIDGERRLTYRELMQRVDGAALRLRELGLAADDRIVVQLPSSWEMLVLTLACLRAGVIPVLALAAHRQHEISYLAGHAEAAAIAVPASSNGFDHQAMARTIADQSDTVRHLLVAGDNLLPGCVDLRSLCQPAADPARARRSLDQTAPDSRQVALMLLSGGTTGLPKLIPRTHDDYGCYVRRTAEISRFGSDTTYLTVLPLGHSLPLGSTLATLRTGGRVVIAPSPAPTKVFATIEQEGVTATAVVPAIVQTWLEYRESNTSHDLSSLRLLLVGGARLPDELARRIVPTLAHTLQQGYGMAEGLVCLTRLDDPPRVTCHTQGRPICDDDELMVVDEEDRPVPLGEPGSLLTRGPCTPRGYYLADEHNSRAFTADGWLRTGDIVRRHPDGNLTVEGRDKDMINRGGEKISAEEVENFAYQLTEVALAAAVAMPDARLGERICLYIVPRPGTTLRLAQVQEVMTRHGVAHFKFPERLVLVESLPITNIGKVDKKALRVDIQQRLAAEQASTPPAVT